MHGMFPRGLVVGVDGSAASRSALAFALREAGLRGSNLHVVTVWRGRETTTGPGAKSAEKRRERAQQLQDVAVRHALGEVAARPVLMRSVVGGDVGRALCGIAETADFLVLGSSRALSAAARPLGAVHDFCLRHAPCALVVVPLAESSEAASRPARQPGYDARARAS
jgi:nucleotide-binding universal stress UspA family protein